MKRPNGCNKCVKFFKMQPFSCLNRYYSIFEKKGEYKGVIMKKSNKAIINTYKTIYSVDIVVANKYTTLEQL